VARDTIVADDFLSNPLHPMYDVAPDGRRLLLLEGDAREARLAASLRVSDRVHR
jgi:hypothetical protein